MFVHKDCGYDLPLELAVGRGGAVMVSFKGAPFPAEILLTGVRWYVAYPLSDRQVEEL
jgi:hypothetical protein